MELTIIGKYGPYPKEGGATSCYLLKGNKTSLVIDLGEGSFSRLKSITPPQNINAYVLTHFHFDHACDVGVMGYYLDFTAKSQTFTRPKLIHPLDSSPYASSLSAIPSFEQVCVQGGDILDLGEFKLEFFNMKHPVKAIGVRVSDGKKTIAFTGDTNMCDSLNDLVRGVDLLVADGGLLLRDWSDNKPHLSVSHIAEITNKCGIKSIISHIYPEYTTQEIQAEIGNSNCIIAEEGKTYIV